MAETTMKKIDISEQMTQ